MTEYEVKAYKIWWDNDPDYFYVGSTRRTLAQRMGDHRSSANFGNNAFLYDYMRENGVNTFKYCMLGSCLVNNSDERRMFEQSYIDILKPILNSIKAHRNEVDDKEYQRKYHQKYQHKPERKEYQQKYHQKYQQLDEFKAAKQRYRQKPERKEYHQKYQQKYIDSKKTTCICGGHYIAMPSHEHRHINSMKHRTFVSDAD